MHSIGLLYAINPILIILFQAPLAEKIKTYNKLYVLGMGAFFMGLGSGILSILTHFSLAVIAIALYTLGEMLFFSVAQYLCYESSSPKKQGATLGVFQATYAASIVIGPLIGSYIYHKLSPVAVWYGCGLIGTLAFCLCFSMRKKAALY